ncbi:hypothetical protein ACTFH7_17420 [Clostridium cagae]
MRKLKTKKVGKFIYLTFVVENLKDVNFITTNKKRTLYKGSIA